MFKTLLARARQGYRTAAYPAEEPALPSPFRGHPELDPTKCIDDCRQCVDACPTGALRVAEGGLELDIGRCIFCEACVAACPEGAIAFTRDWRLASSRRDGLIVTGEDRPDVGALGRELRRLLDHARRLTGGRYPELLQPRGPL